MTTERRRVCGQPAARRVLAATVVVLVITVLATACSRGGAPTAETSDAVIVVNAPVAALPSVAEPIVRGTRLAVDELNAKGGIDVRGTKVRLRITVLDNGFSPERAAANVRRAVADHAVAVVDEGTGVDASWNIAAGANLPIAIVRQGGEQLVDPVTRHNVFRIAPTNRGIAFRLAEHLVPQGRRLAIVHDDSAEGAAGAASLDKAFTHNRPAITSVVQVPARAAVDPAPEIQAARASGAEALVVWALPAVVARVVAAARSAGWSAPIFTATGGEDPVVRQQLAARPDWVEGLTFTGSRLTAEKGPAPWLAYRAAYERRFGHIAAGVRTAAGKPVFVPPDWAMYPYDFVHVLAAAMTKAGTTRPSPALLAALEDVDVPGANGDDRGFNQKNHEGVVDDDIFFAVFHDMVWRPVKDDGLSATLADIAQT